MIKAKTLKRALERLGQLRFFPAVSWPVGDTIGRMCRTDEEVEWLAEKMCQLYDEWPGPHEFRAIFCVKYHPADGIETFSTHPDYSGENVFADAQAHLLRDGSQVPFIASADPAMQAEVAKLSSMKQLPAPRAEDLEVAKQLQARLDAEEKGTVQ